MLVFLKMMKSLPAGSKEINDSDDKLLFAEILSSFSNFYQVAVDQVPATEYVGQLVIGHWSLVVGHSFPNFYQVGVH